MKLAVWRAMPAAALAFMVVSATVAPAIAKDGSGTTALGVFGSWQAYAYPQDGGKVCYAAASADRLRGGVKGRKPTYLAVTNRPGSAGEVSVIGAYKFKAGSDADLQIDGMQNTFFTQGDSAWASRKGADKAIVHALMRGEKAVFHAVPAKGADIVDVIPLSGFTKAREAIDKACKVKR